MKRVRKAVMAGLGAALTAVLTGLGTEIPRTEEGWVLLASAAIGAFVVFGWATYRIPNAGTVNGSDLLPGAALRVPPGAVPPRL
jgi:hypothetical protein